MKSNCLCHRFYCFTILFVLFLPSLLQAHPHGEEHSHDLLHGFLHPLTGFDHLLAMIGVGLWAAQLGGRAIWIVPCSFVVAMIGGGILGHMGLLVPFVEQGIALSVLVLGLAIAFAIRLPTAVPAIIVSIFAVYHGVAHGSEMASGSNILTYAIGFSLATAILHGCGIAIATLLGRTAPAPVLRTIGGAIAATGLVILVT